MKKAGSNPALVDRHHPICGLRTTRNPWKNKDRKT